LGFLSGHEFSGQHLSYLESIHYEYLSYVHALSQSRDEGANSKGLGISAQYLASGDIPGTDVNGNPTGDFSSHYGSYNLAYGQSLGEKLALGVSGKWINAKIDDVSASAYAADVGLLYRLHEKISLAGTVVNVGSQLKFLSEGDDLPLGFHLGGAYEASSRWLLAAEGVYRKTGLASFHAGTQWRPLEAVSLRVGYKTDTLEGLSALAGLTTGLGIHLWGHELAYAWAPYGELGNAQYFSLRIRFGAREESRRNLIHYQNIKKHRAVRGGSKRRDEVEPEYQQLMQLLSEDDAHVARGDAAGSDFR
jgi:hypothetical protein